MSVKGLRKTVRPYSALIEFCHLKPTLSVHSPPACVMFKFPKLFYRVFKTFYKCIKWHSLDTSATLKRSNRYLAIFKEKVCYVKKYLYIKPRKLVT
jgi:hypothetical protein